MYDLTQLESAARVYIYFPVNNMSQRAYTDTLSWRLEAKLKECRDSLSFLEKTVKMAGGQMPAQEQEVLVSATETSAISHKSADRIDESEEELDHR